MDKPAARSSAVGTNALHSATQENALHVHGHAAQGGCIVSTLVRCLVTHNLNVRMFLVATR